MSPTTTERDEAAVSGREAAPVLEISYFTDPLCCWSWGFEPQLRRLRYGYAGRIAWRLRMGCMISDWNAFADPLNDVHRPAQMGPLWKQAGTLTGMPVEPAVWVHDAPSSSVPACLAVKAAAMQSPAAADLYLRAVREAVMMESRNVAREDVLLDLGRALARARPELFDASRFEADLAGRKPLAALEEDVREARFRGIGRFPCLGIRRAGADPAWLVGWRPWDALLAALREYAPALDVEREAPNADAYARYWGGVTEREVAVALGRPPGAMPDGTAGAFSSGSGT